MIGGVAAAAAVRSFPFRVFSFPSVPVRAGILALLTESDQFASGDLVWIMHPTQAKAWDLLAKITKIDQQERTIEIANIRQSHYNWKNLSRSPKPFRVGVT